MTARRHPARSALRVLSLVLLGLISQSGKAADGLWDEKFGGDPAVGVQVAPFPGLAHGRAIAETDDGALWVAGHGTDVDGRTRLALSRMGENGEIDGAFAAGRGALLLDVLSSTFGAGTTSAAVDVAPAGRANPLSVLVAFQYTTQVEAVERAAGASLLPLANLRRDEVPMVDGAYQTGVTRIDASGQVDTSFGVDGYAWVAAHASGVALAREIDVDADGRFYVLETGVDLRHAYITRFDAQGTLDTQFADQGTLELNFLVPTQMNNLVIDTGGAMVIAGAADTLNDGNWDALALRVRQDGLLDATYGDAGRATLALDVGGDNAEVINAIAFDAQRNLVLVGSARSVSGSTCFAARLNASGRTDASWATGGIHLFDIAGLNDCRALSVAVSQAERVAIGVVADSAGLQIPAVQALNSTTGNSDATFGTDATGAVLSVDLAGSESAVAVRFDAQGRTQLALTAQHDKSYPQAFAARLTEDGDAIAPMTALRLR